MREDATFYEVLGVDADASTEAIEEAYRTKVKEYHPDVSDRSDAREQFQRINRAREVLTDRTERSRYDRLGHETYLDTQRRGRSTTDDGNAAGDGETPPQRRAAETDAAGTGSGAAAGSRNHHSDAGGRRTHSARGTRRTGGNGPGDGASRGATAGPTGPTDTDDERRAAGAAGGRRPGGFALREALTGLALVAVAGCLVAVVALLGESATGVVNERLLLAGGWTVVALFAGRFAAGSAHGLPNDVVRVHALPLALFVSAWYLRRVDGLDLLVGGLLAYGAFAALFRTSALVGQGGGSTLRPALVWFLGTAPAVLVLPASRVAVAGRVGPVPVAELGSGLGSLGHTTAAALALGTPVAVALGYGFWRLGRALV